MARLEIPFNGPAYEDYAAYATNQECVNFYLHPYPEASGQKYALLKVPGLAEWSDPAATISGINTDHRARAMINVGEFLYVIIGDQFVKFDKNGIVYPIGTISTSAGRASIASNGTDIIFVAGAGFGWVYNIQFNTLTQITDPEFPNCDQVVHVDGYYLVNNIGTGEIWRSDFLNGLSWDGLAFSTAGGSYDAVIGLEVSNRDVIVIGEKSLEVWYNTGAATFNFARIDGAFVEMGSPATFGHTKINNAVYFLGQDQHGQGQIFQMVGRQPQVVSTLPITYQINSYGDISDAYLWAYQQDGHAFVIATFPTANVSWVYDSTIQQWHQRSSRVNGQPVEWRANMQEFFANKNIVGCDTDNKLYYIDPATYTDAGEEIVCVRTSPTIRRLQNWLTVWEVQLTTKPGVGTVTGGAWNTDPQGMFSWSRDGGQNFSAEVDIPLGAIGAYENRANVHQLGMGRNWIFKLEVSADVPMTIIEAIAEGEEDE